MNNKKNTILIVDSDPQLQKMMAVLLNPAEYKVVECVSGKQAARLCLSIKPDLVLLDLTQNDIDGQDVITSIREWSQVPIIILSQRASDSDVVMALNRGANDYVIRPFSADVLMARIHASLRKAAVDEVGEPEIQNGPLRIDLVKHQVFLDDELIGFTPKEYMLLRYLVSHRGQMLTHKEILKEVWGAAHGNDTQYLRVFIGQIRAKIEKSSSAPVLIKTEPGVGYRMEIAEIAKTCQTIERRSKVDRRA